MKFKIDENLPADVADLLWARGHDADTVGQEDLAGADDTEIYAICQREERIIITLDLDFADIRQYPPEQGAGIVVLRLERQRKEHVLKFLPRLLQLLETESLTGCLCIMDEIRTRIRRSR